MNHQEHEINFDVDSSQSLHDDVNNTPSTRPKRTKIIAVVAILLAASVLLAGYQLGWFSAENADKSSGGFTAPPAVVTVAKAHRITLSPSTTLPGTVVSMRDAVIAAETSGKVVSVALVGDTIEKGQALAVIDSKNASQTLTQRAAELARLNSLYQYHKDYFARVTLDEKRLGIPEIGIAELRSNMETAKADVARAKAVVDAAQTDLDRTSITAPFSGRVVSQSIQPGEYAQVGTSVVRLVDINSLEVSAQVPAALVQPLAAGTQLEITGYGKTVSAPLRALVPVGDQVSRTMELRVTLERPDFLVGSPVRVTLPTAEPRQVLAIPRDAVILRTDSQYIFVVDEQGKAHRRDVTLGYAQDDLIEVVGDVSEGATVIIRGGERLRDGQQVTYTEV